MKRTRWEPTPTELEEIKELAKAGHAFAHIAKKYHVCPTTLGRVLKAHDIRSTWVRPKKTFEMAIEPARQYKRDLDPAEWVSPAERFRHLYR